jgi:glutamate N-acetyltransferase / amino-acid N-acetyltransferase
LSRKSNEDHIEIDNSVKLCQKKSTKNTQANRHACARCSFDKIHSYSKEKIMENMLCPGFKAAGVAAGLKKNGRKDLGLLISEVPANVAGMFTRNLVQAAPVLLDRQRITKGVCRALLANSGNANCCTGEQGMQAAVRMAQLAADAIKVYEDEVLVASTGVIGEPLPVDKIEAAMPDLVKALRPEGISDFAEAIMTTDTVPKMVSRKAKLDGRTFTITGVAKGAGMIHPDMATMLCFVMTDIFATPASLKEMLNLAVDPSLNRITVDGDTSTNDTVLLMASGLSGIEIRSTAQRTVFQSTLDEVMITLAKWLIQDAEGATKLVEINVKGAPSDSNALRIAETVANSNLFKTALFGEDANWGRILAAIGRAGVAIDPQRIDVYFGSVLLVKNGIGCGKAAETDATEILKQPQLDISIHLNMGDRQASVYTCDFSIDYVKINANYRT